MLTKIFLACALGAFIGGLVTLSIWQPIWWVGMIVGGFVGYLSYEFKTVLEAIPVAWQETRLEFHKLFEEIGMAWSSKRARARRRSWLRSFAGLMCFYGNLVPIGILWIWGVKKPGHPEGIIYALYALFVFFATVVSFNASGGWMRQRRSSWRMWRFNTVFLVLYWIPLWLWHATMALGKGAVRIPGIAIAAGRALARVSVASWRIMSAFSYQLFILIHSEIRLLCAVDAAIGATVGYLAGHALIGALAGGLLGVLNYELVSKRWLHLVPSDSR